MSNDIIKVGPRSATWGGRLFLLNVHGVLCHVVSNDWYMFCSEDVPQNKIIEVIRAS